jgi:hypothetical protein
MEFTGMEFPRNYTICIKGNLHERWQDWFDGLTITNLENGNVLLQGVIADQSNLVGIINQIHSLNLELVSVNCEE